jgi:NAD+ diphosphatase
MILPPSRPNPLTGSELDRAGLRREDAAWIEQRLADPDSRFLPCWRNQTLVRGMEAGRPDLSFCAPDAAAAVLAGQGAVWVFLGLREERAIFAIDLGTVEDPLTLLAPGSGSFVDLRQLAEAGLAPADAALVAHARALLYWRTRHMFCGLCGGVCEARSAGHVMACTQCGTHHFPRTDPAVIMLVTSGDRCLLGANKRANRPFYSTLAGFVEPGESLEEAVAREVLEEAGVRVGAVHYHSSQPWPFPASIMLGFYAEGLSEAITIDESELRDARWFTRAEIRDHQALGFGLPGRISIARALIEDWVAAA